MNRNRYTHISTLLSIALLAVACTDSTFSDYSYYKYSGNTIRFDVSSGCDESELTSRADGDDDDEGLSPMIFSEGSDTLYLHRYVVSESERATGRKFDISRSLPVNDIANFVNVNGESGFYVNAIFTSDGAQYFPMDIAVPVSESSSEDIWHIADPTRYWPGTRELRFQAVAPADALGLLKSPDNEDEAPDFNSEVITFKYNVPIHTDENEKRCDAEHQPDLMFATTTCSHYTGNEHDDLAPLNFRHALSAVTFNVRDIFECTIVDISIKNIIGSGTCVYTAGDESPFVWNPDENNKQTFTQTFDYTTNDPYPDGEISGEPSIDPIQINQPEKTFMLIPQEISSDAELEITISYGEENDRVIKTLSGKLLTTDIPEWKPGKEYAYTISTSAENWTYVFDVIGSEQAPKTIVEGYYVNGGFDDNDGNIIIDANVNSGSYYKVRSYRHRTNNPRKWEPVAWTAVPSDNGVNEKPTEGPNPTSVQKIGQLLETYKEKINMELPYGEWLLENWKYEGGGSEEYEEYSNLSFSPQYQVTDWDGDWKLRTNNLNGTEINPLDLSWVEGSRNTANCYVVNAGGWYSIPLYYGNSIKNSSANPSSYTGFDKVKTVDSPNYGLQENPSLEKFKDYLDRDITSPEINDDVADAVVVWEDAYDVIDNVRFDSTNKRIVFHVNPYNLQQSNSIIAIRDNESRIIWSWHIWITEHWVDDNLKLGVGDVECENWGEGEGNFTISPYNLGWCDPKNSYYLQRRGTLTFTQEQSGKSKTLNVIQREGFIEYWIGNNVYYQYGRKDPLVGFINTLSQVKYNFGTYNYELSVYPTSTSIGGGIKEPYKMFLAYNWLNTNYYNLWNNYGESDQIFTGAMIEQSYGGITISSSSPELTDSYAFSAVKTIYDPSPVGYVVPPANMFKLFTKGVANPNSAGILAYVFPKDFNGEMLPIRDYYYEYNAYPNKDGKDGKDGAIVKFNVSGQRFFTDGKNTNQRVVFLWDNTSNFEQAISAYGLAIGYEEDAQGSLHFNVNAYFPGRKGVGRPVRCVKETNQ